jgi:WD40 repeat protein
MAKKQYFHLLAACAAVALVTRFFTLERYVELPLVPPELIVNTGDASEFLVFCPNGTELLSAAGQRAQIKDIATGTVRSNLIGHRDHVSGVAVSPNGMIGVTGDRDGSLRLWEMSSGLPLRVLKTHRSVGAVAASNGWVAAGLGGGGIVVWDTSGGKVAEFHDQLSWITAMCVRSDGALVSASLDGTVKVHGIPDGRLLANYKVYRDFPVAVACNLDGSKVACATESGRLMTWSGNSAEPQVSPPIPRLASAIAYLDDNTLLASTGGETGEVLRWTPGSRPKPLKGLDCNGVLALSPGRTTLACNTHHRAVDVWELEPLNRRQTILEQPRLESAQFSADGRHLVVAADTSLCDWDLIRGKPFPVKGQGPVALSPSGKRWAYTSNHSVYGEPCNLQVAELGQPDTPPLSIHSPEEIEHIKLTQDESSVYFSSNRDQLRQFDTRSGKLLAAFALANLRTEFALSANQLALVSESHRSYQVELLERRTGQRHRLPISENFYASGLTFSPDGSRLAYFNRLGGNELEVYDTQKYRRLYHFECPEQPAGRIKTLTFSPDGRTLAITREYGQLLLLDGHNGKELKHVDGGSLAFTPDSRILAAWGSKGLRLHSLTNGKEQILDGTEENGTLSFSPDGKLLAAANSWAVRLFDTASGEQLASLIVLQPGDEWLVLTPAGLYDGSPEAARRLAWRMGDQTYKLEQFSKVFARPDLLRKLIQGERPKPVPHLLHPAPQAKILAPESERIVTEAQTAVLVELRDLGGGIGSVHLLVNGREAQPQIKKSRANFTVTLKPGPNRLRAYATDAENSMLSASDEITVFLRSASPAPSP